MSEKRQPETTRPRRRSPDVEWIGCVPPRDTAEQLEGEAVLAEFAEDFGVLLWRTVRDVTLWATTPVSRRDSLFAEASATVRLSRLAQTDVPIEIAASLDTINGMLTAGMRGDSSVMAICCLEVAAWAARAGAIRTRLAFAQAAAQASPEFAEAALHTGISAVAAKQERRADFWLRRAVHLARLEQNRPAYATALVMRARLKESSDALSGAEALYRKAYRAARSTADRSVRTQAGHGLFRMALRRGDNLQAAQFALAAYRSCAPQTPGATELLFDIARFWADAGASGLAQKAVARLRMLGRFTVNSERRLVTAALIARATAAAYPPRSALAAAEAWTFLDDPSVRSDARLTAALDLVHAARIRGDHIGFTEASRRVLCLAPPTRYEELKRELAIVWKAYLGRAS